jgi:hypothetical protein
VDLSYPPEAETFRTEVRSWLAANLPDGWGTPGFGLSPTEHREFAEGWVAKLREGRWLCASWPPEYGGRGLSLIEQVVLNEEFARAEAPMRADFFGDTLVGPTILAWGSEKLRRVFLPRILDGSISWCQGFSEPDAGSDLASLRTRAELDGDEWVINGQKVWTTQAQYADFIFLLARTDPEAPAHRGISFLLVPMRQPGIQVRPIQQIDGSAEFNEVFFENARCPSDHVVGEVHGGWKVAMTTLGFERGASATTGYRRFATELDAIIAEAQATGRSTDPLVRQGLARAWSKVKIMQINGYRTLTDTLTGTHQAAALDATHKLFWSEYHQEVLNLAITLLGMDGQVLTGDGGRIEDEFSGPLGRPVKASYPLSPLQAAFLFSRSETIWGGAGEIQRNIIGERILGLPKEPKPPISDASA